MLFQLQTNLQPRVFVGAMYLSGLPHTAVPERERKCKKEGNMAGGRTGHGDHDIAPRLKKTEKTSPVASCHVSDRGGEKASKLVREACVFEEQEIDARVGWGGLSLKLVCASLQSEIWAS